MTERPIIFSAPMVRAILEGRKMQTRRVLRVFPDDRDDITFERAEFADKTDKSQCGAFWGMKDGGPVGPPVSCKYGQAGDRLWVREAVWLPPPVTQHDLREGADTWPKCIYSADTDDTEIAWMRDMQWKQRPSIHMPRWASRILLEITDVRVQRVQDISEEDARAEGVLWVPGHGEIAQADLEEGYSTYLDCRQGFQVLWNSINAKRGFGWDVNPWVWAITFKRVDEAKE